MLPAVLLGFGSEGARGSLHHVHIEAVGARHACVTCRSPVCVGPELCQGLRLASRSCVWVCHRIAWLMAWNVSELLPCVSLTGAVSYKARRSFSSSFCL